MRRTMSDDEGSSGWLEQASNFIDTHLRAARAAPWVLGGLGLLLVYTGSRGKFKQFTSLADVPAHVYAQNTRLCGVVSRAEWNSVWVWHVPIGRRVLRWRHVPPGTAPPVHVPVLLDPIPSESCPCDQLLRVKFAGVAIGKPAEAEVWLANALLGRRVWFEPLCVSSSVKAMECVVYSQGKGLRRECCVNERLLAEGLGSLEDVRGFASRDRAAAFVQALSSRELAAKREGQGMWEGSAYERRWRKAWRAVKRRFSHKNRA